MSFPAISFLIISKDNISEVVRTFNSIYTQMSCSDEVLIVDSSVTSDVRDFLSSFLSSAPNIAYIHIPPNGVYDAQNYCISNAKNDWICFINSGDILLKSARIIIQKTMALRSMYNIFVFGQYFSFSHSSPRASFIPSEVSLWPHQSIVYKRELHAIYGEYNVSFKYCADQIFFAEVRKYEPYFISSQITSFFLTDGLSSGFSFAYSRELWHLYRILQYNIYKSLLLSFVLPYAKALLKLFLPQYVIHKIQKFVTSYRSKR